MKNAAFVIAVAVCSFAAGVFVQSPEIEGIASAGQFIESHSAEETLFASQETDLIGPEIELPSNDRSFVQNNLVDDPNSELEFLDYLDMRLANTTEFEVAVQSFKEWLGASEYPATDIYAYLNSNRQNDQKEVLEFLISSEFHPGLAEDIVSQLAFATDEEAEGWADMLRLVPVETDEAREKLLEVLPLIENPALASTSLQSITPSLISPEERAIVLSNVAQYAHHSDEQISSAALHSLSNWSATGYSHLFEDVLVYGSEQNKIHVLRAVSQNNFATDEIMGKMLDIFNDDTASTELKQQSFNSLSNFQLNEEQYWKYYNYYASQNMR